LPAPWVPLSHTITSLNASGLLVLGEAGSCFVWHRHYRSALARQTLNLNSTTSPSAIT
jgi:hypothetical protein